MSKNLLFFLFMLLLVGLHLQAQVISGHVYDEDRIPLEGAVVYFDGTTVSASTNPQGFFSIKGDKKLPIPLIVSFVGFKTVRINNPYSAAPLEIILQPDATLMDEVVVKGTTIFSRQEMLKAFREQFLGRSRAGESCKIENEFDLRLRFDSSSNILYAEAVRPLRITNKRLKYIVNFDLIASEIRYRHKSLSPNYISGAFFGGTAFFTDVSENGDADKRRKETYLGSPVHLVKTILNKNWEEQKFKIFHKSRIIDPKEVFEVTDTLGIKKINIRHERLTLKAKGNDVRQTPAASPKQRFEILYNKKKQSFMLYETGTFYANTSGLFWPIYELTFGGEMGDLRVGDMLPSDYLAVE